MRGLNLQVAKVRAPKAKRKEICPMVNQKWMLSSAQREVSIVCAADVNVNLLGKFQVFIRRRITIFFIENTRTSGEEPQNKLHN